MKFLIVKWQGNDMVGIFNDLNLNQISNSPIDNFYEDLKYNMSLYDLTSVEIEFVSYEYIVEERKKRGLDAKELS